MSPSARAEPFFARGWLNIIVLPRDFRNLSDHPERGPASGRECSSHTTRVVARSAHGLCQTLGARRPVRNGEVNRKRSQPGVVRVWAVTRVMAIPSLGRWGWLKGACKRLCGGPWLRVCQDWERTTWRGLPRRRRRFYPQRTETGRSRELEAKAESVMFSGS